MTNQPLWLHEEILLLALHDETGRTPPGSPYASAMAGGILAELAFRGRIAVEIMDGAALVRATSGEPIGEPLLDECVERIASAGAGEPLTTCLGRLTAMDDFRGRVAAPLVRRGILREEENGVLLFFTRKGYPAVDMEPERRVVERLRRAIFTDEPDVDPRTIVLLSLARSADLLRRVFPRAELAEREARIEALVSGEKLGRTMREVMETTDDVIAAIVAAVAIPPLEA